LQQEKADIWLPTKERNNGNERSWRKRYQESCGALLLAKTRRGQQQGEAKERLGFSDLRLSMK
jgi:hypothetical protein